MNNVFDDIKKDKVKLISSLVLFAFLVIGITYALIGATVNLDSSDITTKIGSRPVFTADSSDQVILNIPITHEETDTDFIVASDTGSVNISLTTGYNSAVSCSYDLYWQWDSTTDTTAQYTKTSGVTKEYTVSGLINNEEKFSSVQLNDYSSSNLKTKLYSGSIGVNVGEIAYQTWIIKADFWKTTVSQESHMGNAYSGTVVVENVVCEKVNDLAAVTYATLSDTVLAQESELDYSSAQDGSIYRVAQEEVTYNSTTYDAGVRYEGLDPDNYLTFNGETAGWRIIGVFEGSTIGLETGKQYTKIIRNTRIGTYAWDSDGENDWTNSTLNTYLNGTYLSSMTDSDKIAKYNGSYSAWYLRGLTNSGNVYTPEAYINERLTGQAGYRNGTQYAADTDTTGAIGIMYPSDYGYAAYGTSCDNNSSMTLSSYGTIKDWSTMEVSGCATVDWLATDSINNADNEFLISPRPDASGSAFIVGGGGGGSVISLGGVNGEYAVRPTLYLSSDVIVTSGSGSKNNPYKLDLPAGNTLSDTILAKVSEDDYTSSQDGSIYKIKKETVTYNSTNYDAGVRYEGLDPDNYVTFNGETAGWRIIGVVEGSTIGLEPGKQYTKIIRNTRIGSYAWDSDTENDWTNSTLNTYLNGTYLSSMSDSDKIAKYNGNYSTWHLRGMDFSTHQGAFSQDWYLAERITGQAGYRDGTQYAADTETTGAIGIMYPSDYGFGAYGTSCDNRTSMELYNYEGGCAAVNWLATDSINNGDFEWLISPAPDFSYGAFYVDGSSGGYVYNSSVSNEIAVRPVLYLEASEEIDSGTGTKLDPYVLK